jgi:hypothetical protein
MLYAKNCRQIYFPEKICRQIYLPFSRCLILLRFFRRIRFRGLCRQIFRRYADKIAFHYDAKPAEIRALFNNKLEPARTAELRDRMLGAGLPI